MIDYHSPFATEEYYHIYNRGNNKENIFISDDNYSYFLSKWKKYIYPNIDTLAYCLMPNHFHFLIKVKSEDTFNTLLAEHSLTKSQRPSKTEQININELLEKQFQKLFMSYSKAFNKQQNRTGSLFQKRFKRVRVEDDSKITRLIQYIHHNPIHHRFTQNYEEWKYSSYTAMIKNKQTLLNKEEVLNWFDGEEQFHLFHQDMRHFEGELYIDN